MEAMPPFPERSRRTALLLATLWIAVSAVGFGALARYDLRPGDGGHIAERWPEGSALERAADRATLVMTLHPRCPCSRASVHELEKLLARYPGRVRAHVLFLRPTSQSPGWERTALWESASRIPGVAVRADPGGAESRRFGAATSGQAALYDARGALRFRGGVTGSRGHEGDNRNGDALALALTDDRAPSLVASVFGCSSANSRVTLTWAS